MTACQWTALFLSTVVFISCKPVAESPEFLGLKAEKLRLAEDVDTLRESKRSDERQLQNIQAEKVRLKVQLEDADAARKKMEDALKKLDKEFSDYKDKYKAAMNKKNSKLFDPLVTRNATYTHAQILGFSGAALKISHDGGVTTIPVADLPSEIQKTLGFSQPEEDSLQTPLPDPLVTSTASYEKAQLVAIVPDGIRIKHRAGVAHINYEALGKPLQSALGGFKAADAIAYRKLSEEEQYQAVIAIQSSAPIPEETMSVPMPQTIAKTTTLARNSEPVVTTQAPANVTTRAMCSNGVNAGQGATLRTLSGTISTTTRETVTVNVSSSWITYRNGNHAAQQAGAEQVTCSAGRPARNNGTQKGVTSAGGEFRGWVIHVKDSSGREVSNAVSAPEFVGFGN